MLKLFEKRPFIRWKFFQRIVQRQRLSQRPTKDKYKTFDTNYGPSAEVDEKAVISCIDDFFESPTLDRKEAPLHTKLRSSQAKQESRESPDSNGFVAVDLQTSPHRLRRCYSDENIQWEDDDEVDTSDAAGKSVTADQQEKVRYNEFNFRRTSKLRTSLRDLKRKSMSHVEMVKQSVKRHVASRKYDNMDDEQEVVEYETSPGLRRRKVIDFWI